MYLLCDPVRVPQSTGMFGFVRPVLVVIVTVSVVQAPAVDGWVILKVSKSNLTWQISKKVEKKKV